MELTISFYAELGGETEARVVATECDCAECPVGGLGCTCARSTTSLCVQCVDVNCPCAVCVCASTPAVCTVRLYASAK